MSVAAISRENSVQTAPYKVGNFSHGQSRMDVAGQWMNRPHDQRFLSLDDLLAHTRAVAEGSHEETVDCRKLEFFNENPRDAGDLRLAMGGDEVAPTHWSLGQLSALGDFRASELRKLPGVLAADVLNYRLRVTRNDPKIQLYTSTGALRAANSASYGRVFDHELVKAVKQFADTGDWKIPGVLNWGNMHYDPEHPVSKNTTTLYASDRDVFVFLVDDRNPIEVGKLPDGSPDLVFRGFYATNSEVGKSSLKIAGFLMRGICCNRILWGVEDFSEVRIRHTSTAPERFMQEAMPALQAFANDASKPLVEHVKAAKETVIADTQDDALDFLAKKGFSAKRSRGIIEHDAVTGAPRGEGDFPRTVWDFTAAITAEARNVEHTDARLDMERIGSDVFAKASA